MDETLGSIFSRYRTDAGIGIARVERDLKISGRNILALESGDYAKLPEDLYTRNFVRSYARYLGLDVQRLLGVYDSERANFCQIHTAQRPKLVDTADRFIVTPRLIKTVLAVCVGITVLIYLGIQVSYIFRPPELIVTEPLQDLKTTDRTITLAGKTGRETRVFINQKEIYTEPDGAFRATIDLQTGLNVITVSAKKKHSKEAVLYREILVTE